MKPIEWYWIATSDQRYNNWILYRETPLPVHLRPRYDHLVCPECGKVDEDVALRSGIDEDVRIRSSSDAQESWRSKNSWLLISDVVRKIGSEAGLSGLGVTKAL